MSGPDLHVFTLKFLAIKKLFFSFFRGQKFFFLIFFYKKGFYATFHCGRYSAHSPGLIFHIMKYRDQTSVLLSVAVAT